MDNKLYAKLKEIRESKRITIDAIALSLNIKACSYQAIENGEKDIKLALLFKIV